MNKSRIIVAVAILIGLTVAVVTTKRSHEAQTTVEKPQVELPTVKKDEVTAIEIQKPGQPAIVLQKQDKKWKLTAPISADATQSGVDSVLDRLAELEVTGIAATRKENFAKLEVDAEHAIRVKAKAGDKTLSDLHVGASKSGGTMLRIEGQDQVLAAKGTLRYVFDKEPKDFRKHEITEFDPAELTAMTITSAKGTFKFVREGEAWAQAKDEKPIAKLDLDRVQSLASSLSNLRAVDFAEPDATEASTGLDAPLSKGTLTKKDGSTIEISVGKPHASGSDQYARVSGDPVIYRITKFSAERFQPDAKFFEKSEQGGEPVAGPAGTTQEERKQMLDSLPPEIKAQLEKSLAAQGKSPH